jgi:hypothetical protein
MNLATPGGVARTLNLLSAAAHDGSPQRVKLRHRASRTARRVLPSNRTLRPPGVASGLGHQRTHALQHGRENLHRSPPLGTRTTQMVPEPLTIGRATDTMPVNALTTLARAEIRNTTVCAGRRTLALHIFELHSVSQHALITAELLQGRRADVSSSIMRLIAHIVASLAKKVP